MYILSQNQVQLLKNVEKNERKSNFSSILKSGNLKTDF